MSPWRGLTPPGWEKKGCISNSRLEKDAHRLAKPAQKNHRGRSTTPEASSPSHQLLLIMILLKRKSYSFFFFWDAVPFLE